MVDRSPIVESREESTGPVLSEDSEDVSLHLGNENEAEPLSEYQEYEEQLEQSQAEDKGSMYKTMIRSTLGLNAELEYLVEEPELSTTRYSSTTPRSLPSTRRPTLTRTLARPSSTRSAQSTRSSRSTPLKQFQQQLQETTLQNKQLQQQLLELQHPSPLSLRSPTTPSVQELQAKNRQLQHSWQQQQLETSHLQEQLDQVTQRHERELAQWQMERQRLLPSTDLTSQLQQERERRMEYQLQIVQLEQEKQTFQTSTQPRLEILHQVQEQLQLAQAQQLDMETLEQEHQHEQEQLKLQFQSKVERQSELLRTLTAELKQARQETRQYTTALQNLQAEKEQWQTDQEHAQQQANEQQQAHQQAMKEAQQQHRDDLTAVQRELEASLKRNIELGQQLQQHDEQSKTATALQQEQHAKELQGVTMELEQALQRNVELQQQWQQLHSRPTSTSPRKLDTSPATVDSRDYATMYRQAIQQVEEWKRRYQTKHQALQETQEQLDAAHANYQALQTKYEDENKEWQALLEKEMDTSTPHADSKLVETLQQENKELQQQLQKFVSSQRSLQDEQPSTVKSDEEPVAERDLSRELQDHVAHMEDQHKAELEEFQRQLNQTAGSTKSEALESSSVLLDMSQDYEGSEYKRRIASILSPIAPEATTPQSRGWTMMDTTLDLNMAQRPPTPKIDDLMQELGEMDQERTALLQEVSHLHPTDDSHPEAKSASPTKRQGDEASSLLLDETLSLLHRMKNLVTTPRPKTSPKEEEPLETSVLEQLEVLSEMMENRSVSIVSPASEEDMPKTEEPAEEILLAQYQSQLLLLQQQVELLQEDRDEVVRVTKLLMDQALESYQVELEAAKATARREGMQGQDELWKEQLQQERFCGTCQRLLPVVS